MKPNAGVWLDHREAVVIVLTEFGESVKTIPSAVVKQHAKEMPADDIRERVHTEHLSRYYDEIIAHLRNAGAIAIFGPGEAKGELKKRFEAHKDESRAITVEAADNMTVHQVVAMVRVRFDETLKRGR